MKKFHTRQSDEPESEQAPETISLQGQKTLPANTQGPQVLGYSKPE